MKLCIFIQAKQNVMLHHYRCFISDTIYVTIILCFTCDATYTLLLYCFTCDVTCYMLHTLSLDNHYHMF